MSPNLPAVDIVVERRFSCKKKKIRNLIILCRWVSGKGFNDYLDFRGRVI